MKNIVILGSTGSVGKQTIEVIRKKQDYFRIFGLATKDEVGILSSQIKEFKPEMINVAQKETVEILSKLFPDLKIYFGEKGLIKLATHPKVNSVIFSTSGIICLRPLIEAIKKRKGVLVANKEILIIAGEIINKYLNKYKAEFLPLDSEHSAIFQCLKGENKNEIKNLILTCSGGPFRNYSKRKLERVTIKEVLTHPVWKMGPKITVDSATLMNKGFEVIEAHYLFGIPFEKIKVVIHPECIIHSMVEFIDGTTKAQLSIPDMRIPIQYALCHPQRLKGFLQPLNLLDIKRLSFLRPNLKLFPCLTYAYFAGKIGGTMPAVLNFADEIAVEMFLKNKIKFLDIPKIIETIIKKHQPIFNPNLKEILAVESWVQKQVEKIV